MIFIQDSQTHYVTHPAIGEKAKELFKLQQFDVNVPRWVVLPADFMAEAFKNLSSLSNTGDLIRALDSYVFPPSVEAELALLFPADTHFMVRPSAWIEKGHETAFDNQFESFAIVPRAEVLQKVKAVWRSIFSDEILSYRATHRLAPNLGIAVIIQKVVNAHASGLAFGLHPTRGSRKEKLISAVFGISGYAENMETDTYILASGAIDRQIERKRQRAIIQPDGSIDMEQVPRIHQHDQAVADEHLVTLSRLLDDLRMENQQFYQLEFAIHDEHLHILQAQPIYRLDELKDTSGEYTIWDNSNFSQNFGGVITPLTFSCVKTYMEAHQKNRASFFGASKRMIKRYNAFFSTSVGLIQGRLYSNVRVQQTLDAMLPENRVNVHFVPKVQQTTYRFDTSDVYKGSANEAWWNMVLLTGKMYKRYRALHRKVGEFRKYSEKTLHRYQYMDWQTKSANELMQLYLQLERTVLTRWNIPFQTDFFFQLYFGWLQQQTMSLSIGNKHSLATDLLSDSSALPSMQPLHRRVEIAHKIQSSAVLKALFETEQKQQIWHFIQHDTQEETVALRHVIEEYFLEIDGYDDILQSSAINQKDHAPLELIATLQSFLQRHISDLDHARQIESQIQTTAEEKMEQHLRRRPAKRWWYQKVLRDSRTLLRMKEEFDYDYKKFCNVVLRMFSAIGRRLAEEGILEFESDIHFLSKEEIFDFIEGRSITTDINALVGVRKEEYERFQISPPIASQIATYGIPYQSNDFSVFENEANYSERIQGLVACLGKVQGVVRVWDSQETFVLAEGEILVTQCANVQLEKHLVSAAALLIGRGTIWNPLCLLARQMNVPTIVSIEGLLDELSDGDVIEVDAITGEVRKL